MGPKRRVYEQCIFILAFLIAVPLEAVTVPICPTNKIAPHRRHIANWDYGNARTFGAFYDLLAPNSPQYQNDQNDAPPDELQEKPQEDDPDDCGEIEDYDENDLSSLTPHVQRRQGQDKTFFHGMHRPPHNYPMRPPPVRPQRPQKPSIPNYRPTRPPYWSGGFFGTNSYRPPFQQYPSNNIKPIHENSEDFQQPYRPSLVGGPSGHIIGASPARPTTTDFEETTSSPYFQTRTPRIDQERTTYRPYFPSRIPTSTQTSIMYPIRGQRPRNINSNGILGSFVDLLFK